VRGCELQSLGFENWEYEFLGENNVRL